eukprot:12152586-Prorocentrum_lima.AAC.1
MAATENEPPAKQQRRFAMDDMESSVASFDLTKEVAKQHTRSCAASSTTEGKACPTCQAPVEASSKKYCPVHQRAYDCIR